MSKKRRALLLNTSALEKSAAEEDQLARHVFAMGYADMASSLFRQGFLDRAEEAFKNALVVDPVIIMSLQLSYLYRTRRWCRFAMTTAIC